MRTTGRENEVELLSRLHQADPGVVAIFKDLIDIEFEKAKEAMVYASPAEFPSAQGKAQAFSAMRKLLR